MILKDLNDTVLNGEPNEITRRVDTCFICASSSWRLQMWVLCQNIANGNIQDNLDHHHRSLHSDCHMHIWVNSLEDKKPAHTKELLQNIIVVKL
jgi:hypothetical protein